MRTAELWLRTGLWAGLALLGAVEALYLYSHVVFPHLLVISEDGLYLSARAFQQGWDPWALDKIVTYSNNYGWLYPWTAAKLSLLFSPAPLLLQMRCLSAMAALGSAAIVYRLCRRAQVERLASCAASLSALAAWLYGDSISIRPDAFALLFYLGSLASASSRKGWGPGLAGILAALGFFAKAYVALALPLALVLLLAEGRRRDAWICGWTAAGTGLLCCLWTLFRHPHYLFGTLGAQATDQRYSWGHLVLQHQVMLSTHVVLVLGLLGVLWLRRGKAGPRGEVRAWAWVTLALWLALLPGMGGHLGAFLRYYQQLFLPLALVTLALWLQQQGLSPLVLAVLLCADGASMLFYDLSAFPLRPLSQAAQADWAKAQALVAAQPDGAFDPLLADVAEAHGPLTLPTEHSRHLIKAPWRTESIRAIRAEILSRYHKMERGEIPLIITAYEPQFEVDGYRPVDQLSLETPLTAPGAPNVKTVFRQSADRKASKNLLE